MMRKTTLCLLLGLAGVTGLFAQGSFPEQAPGLTPYDSLMLATLPELQAMPVLKSNELPSAVDNSRLKYYRPIYEQVSNECGQVSGIAYNFTYEINRLRDLPANVPENQYPPHFTYNFMNGGYGWYGASYFHSFEILKALGCPSVATYGGMAAGGDSRWMDGYNNYLSAMSNRISEVYQIRVRTEEGLIQLKHWLHNHLDGSAIGGVASFYANSPWNTKTLPEGTPEAGKKVITYWAGNPSHAMTITGYNDSIRYDYNADGKYTNTIDLNDDGILDMRDWEIGGLVFADGWQGGINFGDSGRCYMMYKTLAEELYEGGIWNNAVHILDVKSMEHPRLTAKIRITHDRRGMLRVRLGVAADENAEEPEYTISFPVFNFQGGMQYMQGGWSPVENKTIEFGLDITPLLGGNLNLPPKKFFLLVDERDPEGSGSGWIEYFSVIDYTQLYPVESAWMHESLDIINNSTTSTSLIVSNDPEAMRITNTDLPVAIVGEPYSFQLESSGGTEPVEWTLLHACSEEAFQSGLDYAGTAIGTEFNDHGNVPVSLAFSFPLYGEHYDTIYVHPRGLVMFENTNYPWPYLRDSELLIRNTKCIAPLLAKYLVVEPDSGHSMWVDQTSEMASIVWKGKIAGPSYEKDVEFGLRLYPDGRVEFIYGKGFDGYKTLWSCGVSKGDGQNYFIPSLAENEVIQDQSAVRIAISPLPDDMQLSPEGLLTGAPTEYYQALPLTFSAEDDDHCLSRRTLLFSAGDLGLDETYLQDDHVSAYPNPFSESISIRFEKDLNSNSCRIYNMNGKLVRTLAIRQEIKKGQIFRWDGENEQGEICPAGIYLLVTGNGKQSVSKKLLYTGR